MGRGHIFSWQGADFSFFVGQGRYRLIGLGTGIGEKTRRGEVTCKTGTGEVEPIYKIKYGYGVSGEGDTGQVLMPVTSAVISY